MARLNYDDGSTQETQTWGRLASLVGQNAQKGVKATELKSGGVVIKLDNLQAKPLAKQKLAEPEYIESKYREWTIRVWSDATNKVYGCNYFQGENVRYLEAYFDDVSSELDVFRMAEDNIDKFLI